MSQVAQPAKLEFKQLRVFKHTDLVLAPTIKNEYNDPFSAKPST